MYAEAGDKGVCAAVHLLIYSTDIVNVGCIMLGQSKEEVGMQHANALQKPAGRSWDAPVLSNQVGAPLILRTLDWYAHLQPVQTSSLWPSWPELGVLSKILLHVQYYCKLQLPVHLQSQQIVAIAILTVADSAVAAELISSKR